MSEYIYLLQEREFINTKQNIYKLGKTKQENLQRFKQYPKGSKLLLQQVCNDCDMLEHKLIRDFKNKYIHRKDIGNEYFEGDHIEMSKDIHNKITNNTTQKEDTVKENNEKNIENHSNNTENDYEEYLKDQSEWSLKIYQNYISKGLQIELFSQYFYTILEKYHKKQNIAIKSNFDKLKPYEIITFDEFKKVSDITKIVITNKQTQKGYICMNNSEEALPIDSKYDKRINAETLIGWLQHHTYDEFEMNGNWYYSEYAFTKMYQKCMEQGTLLDENAKPFICDYKQIIKDICKICLDESVSS